MKKIRTALRLLYSMATCGDAHTATSIKAYAEALNELELLEKETIVMAAIKLKENEVEVIERPGRHHDTIHSTVETGCPPPVSCSKDKSGFIASFGRYVERKEAREIAIASGQIKESEFCNELYTENLW